MKNSDRVNELLGELDRLAVERPELVTRELRGELEAGSRPGSQVELQEVRAWIDTLQGEQTDA